MDISKATKYLLFLAFMLMITTFLPIFSAYSRLNIGVNKYWAIVWFVSVILIAPSAFTDKFVLYAFCFLIIFGFLLLNTLWDDVDKWNRTMTIEYLLDIAESISLYAYFRFSKDFDGLALLVKWTLIFIAITAILSIYTTMIDPLYVRNLVGGIFMEDEAKAISKYGGGGYGFAAALTCLFPMIIYYYRNSSKIPFSKPQILIFGILCFVTLLRMQFFANIILSVFVILFAVLGTRNFRKSLTYAGILLILMVSIPKEFFVDILVDASSFFDTGSEVYFKINDMATFIEIGDTGITGVRGRSDRYPLLWEGFKANPITGFYNSGRISDISAGGHLYWMNNLTVYGILGFIPFILIFYFYIKKSINEFDTEFAFYFLLSVFSGIGLGLMKSLFGLAFWCMLFFIIPSLYYLPLLKNQPETN